MSRFTFTYLHSLKDGYFQAYLPYWLLFVDPMRIELTHTPCKGASPALEHASPYKLSCLWSNSRLTTYVYKNLFLDKSCSFVFFDIAVRFFTFCSVTGARTLIICVRGRPPGQLEDNAIFVGGEGFEPTTLWM